MKNETRIPGEFVNTVTCKEILASTGIQLIRWANDIAFTDAAYGENWIIEAANRMATLSEVLNILYQRLPRRSLELEINLPPGVVGVMMINPDHRPDSASDGQDDQSEAAKKYGGSSSIDELPF